MGGTMKRATLSALMTPMFLGRSSTKKSVIAVRNTALYFSARAVPKMWSARWVKSVVAYMEHAVDVTSIVVRTRVMSSFKVWNVPFFLPPPFRRPFRPSMDDCPSFPWSFSSSSANSRTFHGYRVVMAISAACSSARRVNIPNHIDSFDTSSFVVRGITGTSGLRLGMPPPDAHARGRRTELLAAVMADDATCPRRTVTNANSGPSE